MKMSQYRILAKSDLVLLENYLEGINFSEDSVMEGSIVGIPSKHSQCWHLGRVMKPKE